MKIGLIADIHADYSALVEVLRRLDHQHKVDVVLCAGDLTGYGKEPNPVIELIRARAIPTVKGNHDSPSADILPANAEYLRRLPMGYRVEYEAKRLYMCHGQPGVPFIGFSPDRMSAAELDDILDDLQADILIAGHTHIPGLAKTARGVLINPGSVYSRSTAGTSHSYGILYLPDAEFEVYDLLQLESIPPVNPAGYTVELY